jgi:Tfp pilus assembly protein PilF
MTRAGSRWLLGATLLLAPGGAAAQQDLPPLENLDAYARPQLAAGADTNDWEAYFDYAVTRLRKEPRVAEAAFYWASRLDPTRAEPLYGRWVAYWIRHTGWFQDYLKRKPELLESPQVLRVDSLHLRALWRNPFVPQTLEVLIYDKLPGRWSGDRFTTAVLEYSRGQFAAAAADFAKLLRDDAGRGGIVRYYRALCFTPVRQFDSAVAEMTALLAEMRARDERRLDYSYQSKEILEYSLGLLEAARGNRTAAREALGRALVENLAFYPAHAALGELALHDGDTTHALREYAQAVELQGDDAVLRYRYGAVLAFAGRPGDAEVQLRHAVALEPAFAAPYFTLGGALEARQQPHRALAAYRAYVERAPRGAPLLASAQASVAALSAVTGDSARQR